MCIHRKYIYLSTFVYLMVPLCLFLLSWLHVYYGAFCAAVLLFCMCKVFRSIQKTAAASSLCIGRYHIFPFCLFYCFFYLRGMVDLLAPTGWILHGGMRFIMIWSPIHGRSFIDILTRCLLITWHTGFRRQEYPGCAGWVYGEVMSFYLYGPIWAWG